MGVLLGATVFLAMLWRKSRLQDGDGRKGGKRPVFQIGPPQGMAEGSVSGIGSLRNWFAVFACLLAVNVAHCLGIESGCFLLASAAHVAANGLAVYAFLACIAGVFRCGTKAVVLLVVAIAAGRVVASLAIVPLTFAFDLFFGGNLIQIGLLIAGMACLIPFVTARGSMLRDDETATPDNRSDLLALGKKPAGLMVHLVLFGCILSFLHTVGRRIVYGDALYTSAAVDMAEWGTNPTGVATLIAIAVILLWFSRRQYRFSSVWNMLRTVVFTLAVLELLLLPLLSASVFAVVLGDTAAALYRMLFVLGCYFVYEESDYSADSLLAWGLLLVGMGQATAGLALEYNIRVVLADSELFAILRVVAFLMCTAAIFWIGPDNQVRKLWGLRREQTPQQYKDSVVRHKCDVLADEYGLSQREREVLVLVAQGMRVSQVAEMLYVSQNTVRSHIQRIYGKLAIHSYKELAALVKEAPVNR